MLLLLRRRWIRHAAALTAATLAGGVSCREGPIDPGRAGSARLAIAPVFPAASRAAGLVLDQIRLVVIRPPAETIFSQPYPFPASAQTLSIAAEVPLQAQSEELRLDLEAWGGLSLLFRGTTVVRVESGTASGDPVTMPMTYVGPGAQIVRLQIAPRDTVVAFGAVLPFRVSAFDGQGAAVPDFYLTWSSSDPAAVPDPAGVFTAGTARGAYRVSATTPGGARDSTTITVTAPAASLLKTGGDGQSALAGARLALPLEVEVRGSDGLPVPGAQVAFAGPAGGSVDNASVTTNAAGRASTGATLALVAGGQSFSATVGGAGSVTFGATATLPVLDFVAAAQVVAESNGSASVSLRLSSPAPLPVTVPLLLGGTASSPADYSAPASVPIPAGASAATITVTLVADGVAEPDETIILTLGTPTNATLGAGTVHTITITGQTPSVSFASASQQVNETVGTATVTVQLSSPSTQAVTVPFSLSGTAVSPADYTTSPSPLTIPAGLTSGTITVTVVADGVTEPDETVILTLGTPVNATLGGLTSHTLTILAQQPTVSFVAAAQSAGEAAGTVQIAIRLSGPFTSAVTVPFTVAGTATAGSDYTVSASPLVIAPGSVSATISVTLVNDTLIEPAETVILSLGTPTNATLGTPSQHTLTIVDNDFLLSVSLLGRGSGTVATAPGIAPAISCSTGGPLSGCSATYQGGTQVSLIATPFPTTEGINQFEGWTGTGTGFTCTTATTCTVVMDQGRQLTARFSLPGSITFVPASAGFTMVERGTLPAAQAISVTNTGERPLSLDPTIPVTYAPQVTPWLQPKINTLVVDTLTPATMTLNLLTAAATLPAGSYQATVIVRDAGLQRSWTLQVTLNITPPPTPPAISNIVVTLLQLNDAARCTLGTPAASSFRITFDYSDVNGDGPLSLVQAALNIDWLFRPLNNVGGFTNYTYLSSLTGNGSTGSANTVQCYRFGSNTSVDVTMSIVDQAGLRSAGATTTILKPAGSN